MATSKYLDVILDNIENERCALLIGPNLATTSDGKLIQDGMRDFLENQTDLKIDFDLDNLILFKDKLSRTFFYTELKKFYLENKDPNPIHQKLVRIPWHLVISVNPDLMLKNAFDQLGIEVDFQYYNKKKNPQEIERPTRHLPLLYNLFGNIYDEDSLIVTHDDLFEFLFAILGGEKRMPRELKSALRSCRIFIFLGFDFKKWYLRLILRLFELHLDAMPIAHDVKGQLDDKTRNFYINNFEMQFIDQEEDEIIDALYKRFDDAGKLREVQENAESPIEKEIKKLISEDEIDEALETLEDYLETRSEDLFNQVMMLSGNYRRVKSKIRKGIIREDDQRIELNIISNALLEIVDELKTVGD